MNGVRLNLAVRAIGHETMLGRQLDEIKDNGALVEELYLRTLSREPTETELQYGTRILQRNQEPLGRV